MVKNIKEIFTITLFCLVTNLAVVTAQDLTIHAENSYLVDSLGSEIIFEIELTNNSSGELGVTIIRKERDIPATWSSSLCFANCFAPFVDSISTTPDFGSTPLAPGESRVISLHVFPLVEDAEAIIEMKFVNEQNSIEEYKLEFIAASAIISVDDENSGNYKYRLSQNYPNPFNPSTIIEYSIPSNGHGEMSNVTLKVYDILGREIITLVNREQSSGNYKIQFNAEKVIPSGVYFYELRTNSFHQVKKMILEK